MILLVDNYDSFVYNLVQYIGEISDSETAMVVRRNDRITIEEIRELAPSHIIISPGPCTPNEAGISLDIIAKFSGRVPILGVCLGHQAIGQVFGGRVVRGLIPVHGKVSQVFHSGEGIFHGIEQGFVATRYHSLVVERETLPEVLQVTALTADGEIMALQHRDYSSVIGVQFHPESILTAVGPRLLAAFLQLGAEHGS